MIQKIKPLILAALLCSACTSVGIRTIGNRPITVTIGVQPTPTPTPEIR